MENKKPVADRPLKVFLCHASEDRKSVQELYQFLESRGVDAWLDKRKLIGGQTWRREIVSAIFDSNLVLICISRNSIDAKGFVNTEIRLALDVAKQEPFGKIFIIPVRLEECEVPFELKEYQWVDLFEEDGYERLLRSLQARAKQLAGIRRPATAPIPKSLREADKQQAKPVVAPQASAQKPKSLPEKVISWLRKNWILISSLLVLFFVLFAYIGNKTGVVEIPDIPAETPQALAPIVDKDDGMKLIYVPAGTFVMGASSNEQNLILPAFRMDEREVTNAQYVLCVNDGACRAPSSGRSFTRLDYYSDSIYKDYPVINVSWSDAGDYCQWAGRRLPAASEWEQAARGADGRIYPWGNAKPTDELLNFNNSARDTVKVATKFGVSPYKLYDMAGNVAEWVQEKVVRGGSWKSTAEGVTVFAEKTFPPESRDVTIGFRCAMDE